DVGEVGHRDAVGDRAGEAHLLRAEVKADDAPRSVDGALDTLAAAAAAPVGPFADEGVDRVEVQAARVVVELEASFEAPDHRAGSAAAPGGAAPASAGSAASTARRRASASCT